jgi:hypothetical protein
MFKTLTTAFAISLAIAPAVQAGSKPATPEEIAEASARADQIIAEAGVADLFENVTRGKSPTALHKASGVYCFFDSERPGKIIVLPNVPRGEGIGCEAPRAYWTYDYTVRRAASDATAKKVLAEAIAAERSAHPQLGVSSPPRDPYGPPPAPSPDPDVWLASRDGKVLVHIAVRVQDGWAYEARTLMPTQVYQMGGNLAVMGPGDMLLPPDVPHPSPAKP